MPERARRRGWMLVLGAVLIVGLVGAAAALWFVSSQRLADNVAGFARAPVGCDTTLDFEATGRFMLYVESSGEFGQLAGACGAELRYSRDLGDVPVVDVTLVDPNGDEIVLDDLDDGDDFSYDVDGFVGSAARTVEIGTPGDHVLAIAPTGGAAFAVAVGRAPDEGVWLLRWGAVAAAIVGLVLGGLFLVLGSRRSPAPIGPADPWAPDGRGWPSSPPGFPVPPPTTGATGPAGPTSWPTTSVPEADQPSPWGPPPRQ